MPLDIVDALRVVNPPAIVAPWPFAAAFGPCGPRGPVRGVGADPWGYRIPRWYAKCTFDGAPHGGGGRGSNAAAAAVAVAAA